MSGLEQEAVGNTNIAPKKTEHKTNCENGQDLGVCCLLVHDAVEATMAGAGSAWPAVPVGPHVFGMSI